MWEYKVGKQLVYPSAVADEIVIVPSSDGKIYALHQSNGTKVWDMVLGGDKDFGTCPAIADGEIYVVFGNTLYAIASRSTLTISVSEKTTKVSSKVVIEGDLSPARSGASITIQVRSKGDTVWTNLATVATDEAEHYLYSWTPETDGVFELSSYWKGDAFTAAIQSDTQVVNVEKPPPLSTADLLIVLAVTAVVVAAIGFVVVRRLPKGKKVAIYLKNPFYLSVQQLKS